MPRKTILKFKLKEVPDFEEVRLAYSGPNKQNACRLLPLTLIDDLGTIKISVVIDTLIKLGDDFHRGLGHIIGDCQISDLNYRYYELDLFYGKQRLADIYLSTEPL